MKLDLHHVMIAPVSFEGDIEIDSSYYQNTDILEMPAIHVLFSISRDLNQEDIFRMEAQGNFYLQDSLSLESVLYPFHFEVEEKIDKNNDFFEKILENSKNTLDIIEILWENIVLEIPISYSASENSLNLENQEGYELTTEEKKKEEVDPRLAPLLGLLDKEKE